MVVKLHMFLKLATDGRHIHAPATLLPEKQTSILSGQEDGGGSYFRSGHRIDKKIICLCLEANPGCPARNKLL
jgi:hypothetical protein